MYTRERKVPRPLSEMQGRSPRMTPPLQEDNPWFLATQKVLPRAPARQPNTPVPADLILLTLGDALCSMKLFLLMQEG